MMHELLVIAAVNPFQGIGQAFVELIVGIATWIWLIASTLAQDGLKSAAGALGVYHFISLLVSLFHRARGGLAETAHRHVALWEMADHILGPFWLTWCLAPLAWIPAMLLYISWKYIYKGTAFGFNQQFRRELRVDALNTVRFWMAGILIYSAAANTTMLDAVWKIITTHLLGPATAGGASLGNVISALVGSVQFWLGLVFTLPVAAFLLWVIFDEVRNAVKIFYRNGIPLGQPIPPGHRRSITRAVLAVVDAVVSVGLQLIAMAGGIALGKLSKGAGGWLFVIIYLIWVGAYIGVRQPHFRNWWLWAEKINDDTGKQACISIASMLSLGFITSLAIYTTALTFWGDLLSGHVH